jgi:hypothetical protein
MQGEGPVFFRTKRLALARFERDLLAHNQICAGRSFATRTGTMRCPVPAAMAAPFSLPKSLSQRKSCCLTSRSIAR